MPGRVLVRVTGHLERLIPPSQFCFRPAPKKISQINRTHNAVNATPADLTICRQTGGDQFQVSFSALGIQNSYFDFHISDFMFQISHLKFQILDFRFRI